MELLSMKTIQKREICAHFENALTVAILASLFRLNVRQEIGDDQSLW